MQTLKIVTVSHMWRLNLLAFFVKQELKNKIQDCHAENEGLALQSLELIRTVRSFKGESDEVQRYNEAVEQLCAVKRRSGIYSAMFGIIYRVR